MSDEFWKSLGLVATAIAAITSAVSSFINRRKIQELHKTVDGKMEKLLQVTASGSKAEGKLEGKAEEKGDQAEREQNNSK